MWTCHPPMHFSVHRTAHTDYYKNKCCDNWPVFPFLRFFFPFFFLVSGDKGLSVKRSRPKIRQKPRTPSLFTAVVFPCLAAACIAHWTIGTFRAAILLAFKLFFPRQQRCALHETMSAADPSEKSEFEKKKKKRKQNYTKSSWILKDWGFFFFFFIIHTVTAEIREEKKNKREQQCYIWVSHHQHSTCVKPQLFWDFPSCRSRWCQLTPRCAGHSFMRWYDLLENNTAGQAQHMCRINLARSDVNVGKVRTGLKRLTRCCRAPGALTCQRTTSADLGGRE